MAAPTHLEEPRKFDFIDALRGLAILAVILVHAQDTVAAGSLWLQLLMSAGARGVQLFYIASALTLCSSWDFRATRERRPVRNFYLRRLFRITPMFHLAIAGYLLLYGLSPRYYAPNGVPWYYVPLTALFLNGFHPETITSVVPGGWSIAVEMTFYLAFPFLIRWSRTIGSLTLLLGASLILAWIAARLAYAVYGQRYPPEQLYLVDALSTLNFLSQLPVFIFGIMVFWVLRHREAWRFGLISGAVALTGWIVASAAFGDMPLQDVLKLPVAMGAAFALLTLLLERWPFGVLVNPVTILIGKLSFSMYLTHFAIIDFFRVTGISARFGRGDGPALLHYLLVVVATAGVSWICYRAIERPGIAAGRRLIERLEEQGRGTIDLEHHDHQAQRRSP